MFRFFGFILYPLCSKTFASSWNLIPLGCLFIFCIIFSMSDINILLSLSNHKGPRIALHHLWMFLSAIMILYLILLVNTFIEIIYKNKEPALIQRWLFTTADRLVATVRLELTCLGLWDREATFATLPQYIIRVSPYNILSS